MESFVRGSSRAGVSSAGATSGIDPVNLKLGSIPIHVSGRFFLLALFLGIAEGDPVKLAIWVVIVLVSVLVHELGHASVGMVFGLVPQIELHAMGGLTRFSAGPTTRGEIGTGKSIAISLAGPFAGFLLAAIVFVAQRAGFLSEHPLARHALSLLTLANVVWSVFNLTPILPLDGGNVLRSFLRGALKDKGDKVAFVVSILVAVGLVGWSIRHSQWVLTYLGVLYAFQNVQSIRQAEHQRAERVLTDAIEKSHDALPRR